MSSGYWIAGLGQRCKWRQAEHAPLNRRVHLLAMGDEDAFNLGLNIRLIKTLIYLLASMLVGILVSVSGVIGFVGLLIPHITRLIFTSDNRIVLPGSFDSVISPAIFSASWFFIWMWEYTYRYLNVSN